MAEYLWVGARQDRAPSGFLAIPGGNSWKMCAPPAEPRGCDDVFPEPGIVAPQGSQGAMSPGRASGADYQTSSVDSFGDADSQGY